VTHPAPRRRTVEDVAGPYANYLVPVPAASADVCEVCRGVVTGGYSRCYPCNDAAWKLDGSVADVVAFVSLAPTGEQLANELFTYKRETVPANLRAGRLTGLAAVLWKWLAKHESCMASQVGLERFDVITTVPSTSGREGDHPLERLVGGVVSGSAERYEALLSVNRTDLGQREHAADRYLATRALDGPSVLVIDDTWTTGAHAQSASAALKDAGAGVVGVLALGRWLTVSYEDNRAWLAKHRAGGWDWERCCLE
jgi:hypothetical protein